MKDHLSEKVNQHLQLSVKSNQEITDAFTSHKAEMQRYMQSLLGTIRQLQRDMSNHKKNLSDIQVSMKPHSRGYKRYRSPEQDDD